MRRDIRDCPQCFVRGCDCECKTCVDARNRNDNLSLREITQLALEKALEEKGCLLPPSK